MMSGDDDSKNGVPTINNEKTCMQATPIRLVTLVSADMLLREEVAASVARTSVHCIDAISSRERTMVAVMEATTTCTTAGADTMDGQEKQMDCAARNGDMLRKLYCMNRVDV